MFYKISQISINPKARPTTTSNIYIGQVNPEKELIAGKLFMIIEVDSTEPEDLKIMNFLIDDISLNYYQNDRLNFREYGNKLKIDSLLEATLTESNKKLVKFCTEHKIPLHEKSINITVGVIHKENVYFSIHGNNKALLIAQQTGEEKSPYKVYDILKQTRDNDDSPPANNIIFSNIISGHMPKYSYFFFSNEALPEYLSSRELIKIITTLPPSGAVEQIKNSLAHINSYLTFLGIIIKNTTGRTEIKVKEIKPAYSASSQSSITSLNNTERSTEKLLSARGMISLQKPLDKIIGFISSKTSSLTDRGKTLFLGERIILKKRGAPSLIKKSIEWLKAIALSVFFVFNFLFKKLKNLKKPKQDDLIVEKKSSGLPGRKKYFGWFTRLKTLHKIYLAVALISLALFFQNVFFVNKSNKTSENQVIFNDLSASLQQKQNQIDSLLLYDKEGAQAKSLLEEFKSMLDKLPQDNDEQKQNHGRFTSVYNAYAEKIRHVVKIDNPSEVANLRNISNEADPLGIELVGEEIFIPDSNARLIYKYEVKKSLTTSAPLANTDEKIRLSASEDGLIYLFTSSSTFLYNSLKQSTTTYPSSIFGSGADIKDIKIYNNRLYSLDKSAKNIFRSQKSSRGYSKGDAWLKGPADLANSVSLSIDGNVYALSSDGNLTKFHTGVKADLALAGIDPVLKSGTKIIASQNNDFLYILDQTSSRLVVYNKKGEFIQQYLIEKLKNMRDFAVDETDRSIYVLNGSSMYKFPATHLNPKK